MRHPEAADLIVESSFTSISDMAEQKWDEALPAAAIESPSLALRIARENILRDLNQLYTTLVKPNAFRKIMRNETAGGICSIR